MKRRMLAALEVFRPRKTNGIVMGVVGETYLAEAVEAARNTRAHMDIDIDLTTNQAGARYIEASANSLFSKVHIVDTYNNIVMDHTTNRFVKILSFVNSRFSRSLFLDSDVFILSDISEMFSALDVWDLIACHAPGRITSPDEDYLGWKGGDAEKILDLSLALRSLFPEINSGVVGFSQSRRSQATLAKWLQIYNSQFNHYITQKTGKYFGDQGSLRRAILAERPNMYVMPPEFNIRVPFPFFIGNGKARIVHGRGAELEDVRNIVNTRETMRVGLPLKGLVD